MDILKSCITKIKEEELEEEKERKRETDLEIDISTDNLFKNIFKKCDYSYHDEIETDAVLLLADRSKPVFYPHNRRQLGVASKKEMKTLDMVLNDANYIDYLKKRVYNIDYQNYEQPICKYEEDGQWKYDLNTQNAILTNKYKLLKEEYNDLLLTIDSKIHLELIKAGVFYNKTDVKRIFEFVRSQQTELNAKKKIVKIQTDIIEYIKNSNSLNKRKLRISQKKIQTLIGMCMHYFQEKVHTKKILKNVKRLFLEYKMVLENVVYCCEEIGGDKIALIDGIKAARTQTDLSAATCLLKIKQVDNLQKNLIFCEQKVHQLEDKLKEQLHLLSVESKDKAQAQIQLKRVQSELTETNKLIVEIFSSFKEVLSEVSILQNYLNGNDAASTNNTRKNDKYNAVMNKMEKHLSKMNVDIQMESAKKLTKLKSIRDQQEFLRKRTSDMEKLMKEKIQKEEEEAERQKKEKEEAEKKRKELEEEEERKRKQKEEEEAEERRRKQKEEEEAENIRKKLEEEEENKRKELEEQELIIAEAALSKDKKETIESKLKEMDLDTFTYEQCVDFIYKMNLPLTEEHMNELQTKNELTKEELSTFAQSLIHNEEETLQNMIAFFEIWDVKKSGMMRKDLFASILEQFGDQLGEEESLFLKEEMNVTNGPNVYYVDILTKWMYGE